MGVLNEKRCNICIIMKKYRLALLFCFLLLFFILLYFTLSSFNTNENYNLKYHIVCARYNKDVEFLKKTGISYSVMQKGDADGEVPNKANEATSFLYYIINNYDNLPDNMIFIHDEDESWHHEGKITEKLTEWILEYEKQEKGYYEFNNKQLNTKNFSEINNSSLKNTFSVNEAGKNFWNDCMYDDYGEFNENLISPGSKCCAQFIVSNKTIHRHNKIFYEKIYNWLILKTNGTGVGSREDEYSGYMTGRYLEWTWNIIFLAPMRTF